VVAFLVLFWRPQRDSFYTTSSTNSPSDADASRSVVIGHSVRGRPIVATVLGRPRAPERVIVFGLGHVGRALGPLLGTLGFEVVACDDGETGATEPPPAWAVVESFDPAEVETKLGGFTAHDYVLIVTRDHAIDQQLLEQLLGRDNLAYLGMIGSRGKVGRFKKRLEARGLLDGEVGAVRLARLHAPIGVDIGAETPEEIAVAIAAELVAHRRRGDAKPRPETPPRLPYGADERD